MLFLHWPRNMTGMRLPTPKPEARSQRPGESDSGKVRWNSGWEVRRQWESHQKTLHWAQRLCSLSHFLSLKGDLGKAYVIRWNRGHISDLLLRHPGLTPLTGGQILTSLSFALWFLVFFLPWNRLNPLPAEDNRHFLFRESKRESSEESRAFWK